VEVGGVANIMLAALLRYQGTEAILKHLVKKKKKNTLITVLSKSNCMIDTSDQVDVLLMHLLGRAQQLS